MSFYMEGKKYYSNRTMMTIFIALILFLCALITFYVYWKGIYRLFFIPNHYTKRNHICEIPVSTLHEEKYRNDCLHPCWRVVEQNRIGKYWLVQSPYYAWDDSTENPILYHSHKVSQICSETSGVEVIGTPFKGYNSDPMIYAEDGKIWVFWREWNTPLCDKLGVKIAVVGVSTVDGETFSKQHVYITSSTNNHDKTQCPILIKKDGKYLFYACWYNYNPKRENLGIVIWEGTSLENPDFNIKELITIPKYEINIIEKRKKYQFGQVKVYRIWNHLFDLWHFDLIPYKGMLLMVAVEEWGQQIKLFYSTDFKNFKMLKKPLVDVRCFKNNYGHNALYKPTAIVELNVLKLLFTSCNKEIPQENILWLTEIDMKAIERHLV